jgi:MoaA/NifB/PqqE/SkfB family radical SAM enzyme
MKYLKLLNSLPQYPLARYWNSDIPLPINLTVGTTYHCNARCFSCRIYDRPVIDELKTYEWERIFKSIGKALYWVTLSGGEPFIRTDLVELFYYVTQYCEPAIVNIPTNAQLTDKIVDSVWQMCKLAPETNVIINISLDHYIPEKNDEIRGIKGYFNTAIKTLYRLQSMDLPNLTVGIHSVISKANVKDIKDITEILMGYLKDKSHYITEIAENRVELGTVDLDITPKLEDYKEAVSYLKTLALKQPKSIIRSFRQDYYNKVVNYFDKGKHIPCYAGFMSCQITPEGMVTPCCIRYDNMGSLRMFDYDFKKLWNGLKAYSARDNVIRCGGCPLANASYTNSLLHVPTLLKVVKGLVL